MESEMWTETATRICIQIKSHRDIVITTKYHHSVISFWASPRRHFIVMREVQRGERKEERTLDICQLFCTLSLLCSMLFVWSRAFGHCLILTHCALWIPLLLLSRRQCANLNDGILERLASITKERVSRTVFPFSLSLSFFYSLHNKVQHCSWADY